MKASELIAAAAMITGFLKQNTSETLVQAHDPATGTWYQIKGIEPLIGTDGEDSTLVLVLDGPPPDGTAEERILAARTRAVEQERDKAKQMLGGWQKTALQLRDQHEHEFNRAEAAEQRVAGLEAAVLALAGEECLVSHSVVRCTDYVGGTFSDGATWTEDMCCLPCRLRALVPDTSVLDRVRREAVEAALAPIEVLVDVTLDWYASDKPLISADQLGQALAAARDTAGVSR